jgi:hypothetical protein
MEKNTFYIVQYNDRYGNGNDTKIEVLVRSQLEFNKWLKEHNAERIAMEEEPEGIEEFNLIPISLYESKK